MSFPAIPDIKLVEAIQSGDVEAFSALVERYKDLVCAVSYSATGDRVLSEDVAQETFLSVWRCRTELREPAKLRSWLCGIARNLGHKALRSRAREVPIGLDLDTVALGSETTSATLLNATIDRESEQIVWDALKRMPATYREPLVLFYQQDRSVEQVASELGLTTSAVKKRLYRGQQRLKDSVAGIVKHTLSQHKPSKGFVAAVVAGISAGASAPASGTTAVKSSTITKVGVWIMVGKTGFGVAIVAAAIVAWLLLSNDSERPVAQAASEVLDAEQSEGSTFNRPVNVKDTNDENMSMASLSVGEPQEQRQEQPQEESLFTKTGGIEPDAMKLAEAQGLRQCFGLQLPSREFRLDIGPSGEINIKITDENGQPAADPQVAACMIDHLKTSYSTMGEQEGALSSAIQACPDPSRRIEPFSVYLDLETRAGHVTAASLVGTHSFADNAGQLEACVQEAFAGVTLQTDGSQSSKRLWFAADYRVAPPPPDLELFDALDIGEGSSRGSENAPVTAVVFVDFNCQYSSRLLGTLDQLLEEYEGKMRLVVKQFPVHDGSDLIAQAALAAGAQGKFWEMHDVLFANQGSSQEDRLRFASEIGLDLKQYEADVATHRFAQAIEADQEQGYSMGVKGTPTLLIAGQRVSGDQSVDIYRRFVDEALEVVANK